MRIYVLAVFPPPLFKGTEEGTGSFKRIKPPRLIWDWQVDGLSPFIRRVYTPVKQQGIPNFVTGLTTDGFIISAGIPQAPFD